MSENIFNNILDISIQDAYAFDFVNIRPDFFDSSNRAEESDVKDEVGIESSKVSVYNGRTPWINLGRRNDLYEYDLNLLTRSSVASSCIDFIEGSFNTDLIYRGTDEDVNKAKDIYKRLKLDFVKGEMFSDLVRTSGACPQVIWGEGKNGTTEIKKIVYYDSFDKLRFSKKSQNDQLAEKVYVSSKWGLYKGVSTLIRHIGEPDPICGSNFPGFGDNYVPQFGNSYYIAKLQGGKQTWKYYPKPIYHTEAGLNALWQEIAMSQLTSSLVDNNMSIDYMVVIRRPRVESESDPNAEKKKRQSETKMLRERSELSNQGKAMVVWMHPEQEKKPIEFVKIPKIESHEFWESLTTVNYNNIKILFGITNPSFVGLQADSTNRSNAGEEMIQQFLIMKGSIGDRLQKPIISFFEWVFNQFDIDVEVEFQDPNVVRYRNEFAELQRLLSVQGTKEKRQVRENSIELPIDENDLKNKEE